MKRQIVLDTETTGLDPAQGHRIIEIGCVELINRRLTDNIFHAYVNPQRDIEFGAEQVHGLTSEFLQDKPLFDAIVDDFIQFVDGAELIIHNAPFDLGFLNHEFNLLKRKIGKLEKSCSIVDTLVMARRLHPGQRNSLDALCKRYNIDNSQRRLHGALIDADLLALTYLAMTSGQESLFTASNEKTEQTENQATIKTTLTTQQNYHLKVIKATPDELAEHEAQLREIEKISQKNK